MKILLLVSSLILLGLQGFSQITIKKTDIGKPWDAYKVTAGPMDSFFIRPHRPNRSMDIDFYNSTLPNGKLESVGYFTPAYSEFEDSLIKNDNMMVSGKNREEFYVSTDGSLKLKGYVKYMMQADSVLTPVLMTFKNGGYDLLKLDVNYGDSVRRKDSFVTTRWKDSNTGADKVIKGTANRRILADGYGRIKMPDQKTYDFLRIKTVYGDTLYYYTDSNGVLLLDSAEVNTGAVIEYWAKNWGYPLARFGGTDEKFSKPLWYEVVMPNQVQLGINKPNTARLNVYPNPAKNEVTINNLEPGDEISLYNLQGKLIFSTLNKTDGSQNINLSAYPKGVYILRIVNQTGEQNTHQIVKQ